MATMKIKKGDMVKVIAGKDKDKEGKFIAVNKKKNTVLVEGEEGSRILFDYKTYMSPPISNLL